MDRTVIEVDKQLYNEAVMVVMGRDGCSALHRAAKYGHVPMARLLLDHGWDMDKPDDLGWTPLHWAAFFGKINFMVFMAVRGAKINTQTEVKETPLHLAAEEGEKEAVKQLLCWGADRQVKNSKGKTAEELSLNDETRAVFMEIEDQGQEELLARAEKEEDWITAAVLYSRGVDTEWMDMDMKQKVAALAGRWYRFLDDLDDC